MFPHVSYLLRTSTKIDSIRSESVVYFHFAKVVFELNTGIPITTLINPLF